MPGGGISLSPLDLPEPEFEPKLSAFVLESAWGEEGGGVSADVGL